MKELNSVQKCLVILQSQNKRAIVSSTEPQKEHVSSISEYLEIKELTGSIL